MATPVVMVNYDPRWPEMYERARQGIVTAGGDEVVAVEHVGSTAVPGLSAKPIIDIMAGVRRLADVERFRPALETAGYVYRPEMEQFIPDRRFFTKSAGGVSVQHLHVAEYGGEFWLRHLLFRDYLRAHPQIRDAYDRLKRQLAARFRDDRAAYTDAKTEFIQGVVALARAEPDRS
jgi:GrpB-like predicted nucleotidyltransferase (UPF0157 family)